MHVDGFRFDLASILARDAAGHVLPNPPVLWDIESDPLLAGTKLIAEAGMPPACTRWAALSATAGRSGTGASATTPATSSAASRVRSVGLADRMIGSPEIYGHKEREPEQSVNFVTCHDGFTLNDLVSYNDKHNEANGEENRDGAERQPELELRRRRPQRRSRRGETPQPAGEELPDGHDALAGRAHDLDGRRSPAHAGRQQQRLLPGQRNQLVRLDTAREARGCASLPEAAHRHGGCCAARSTSASG